MKNFILAMIVCVFCSVSFAGDCGSCRQPVRNTVGAVARVATAPVRVTRRVLSNVRGRMYCRRHCR